MCRGSRYGQSGRDVDQQEAMGFINLEWHSGSGLTLGEAPEETGTSRQPTLRCADVHPVTCDAEWTAPSTNEPVARAVDHGVRAHGLNPGRYTRQRIAAIRRAARSAQASAPPDSRSETRPNPPGAADARLAAR